MTLLELAHHAATPVQDVTARRTLLRAAIALLAVALCITFVDGSLAIALGRLPEGLVAWVGAATANLKGFYFIAAALAASVASALFAVAATGSRRVALRTFSVAATYVFAASLAALVVATILKIAIGRARPELMAIEGPHAFAPFSTSKAFNSFPSGEAMMTAAFFGACARLALPRFGWAGAALIFAPAVALALARLVVGAHYLSDIVAGLLLSLLIVVSLYGAVEHRLAGRMASPSS
jgi:undecaprenyl-diphosphatase